MRLTESRLRRIIREELIRENLENEIEAKFGTAEDNVKPPTGADFKAAARSPQVKRLVDDLLQDPGVVAALQAALGGAGQVTEATGGNVLSTSFTQLPSAAYQHDAARSRQLRMKIGAAVAALGGGGLAALMATPGMIPVIQAIVNASGAPTVSLLAGLGLAGGAGVALLTALVTQLYLSQARKGGEEASAHAVADAYYQSTFIKPRVSLELLKRALPAFESGGSAWVSLPRAGRVLLTWVLENAPRRPTSWYRGNSRNKLGSEARRNMHVAVDLERDRIKFDDDLTPDLDPLTWLLVSSERAKGKSYEKIAKEIKAAAPKVRKIIEEFDLEKALGRPLIDAIDDYDPSTEAAEYRDKVGTGQWTPETAGYYDTSGRNDSPDWYEEDRAAYNTTSTRRGVRRRRVDNV